jgi:hypothetical protein
MFGKDRSETEKKGWRDDDNINVDVLKVACGYQMVRIVYTS